MFNVQKWKGKDFFELKQLCHGTKLDIDMSHIRRKAQIFKMFLKRRAQQSWQFAKRYIFSSSYT